MPLIGFLNEGAYYVHGMMDDEAMVLAKSEQFTGYKNFKLPWRPVEQRQRVLIFENTTQCSQNKILEIHVPR